MPHAVARLGLFWLILLPVVSLAQSSAGPGLTTDGLVHATAVSDECFAGVGSNSLANQPPCADGQIEKVNEAYVWGMALANDKVFFGTVANTHCLVIGTYLQTVDPVVNDAYVCEFGDSPVPNVPASLGDYRPPGLYMYDPATQVLQDLSAALSAPAQAQLAGTVGIRAAGASDGVVLFAGLSLTGGVNFFAFTDSGDFISSSNLSDYSNIRKFKQVNGALYAGLGTSTETGEGGQIVRWTGDIQTPIQFEVVGEVDSEVAELTEHEGRVFVTTWPNAEAEAGLYMSPLIGSDNVLGPADASQWTKVFTVSDYEPNPISASVYGLGALASFDGYLFWGTMHVPGTGIGAHEAALDEGIFLETESVLLAERSISIFRGRNFSTTPEINLLYGYPAMGVLDPTTGSWTTEPNNLSQEPLFGGPGFNNFLNNYTWTMAVHEGRLWVGTMDVGGLLAYGTSLLTSDLPALEQAIVDVLASTLIGADLWFFPGADSPAIPESLNGAGNPANYGFRTMETDGERLWVGTANPMNLLTGEADRTEGKGGWELLSIQSKLDNTPIGEDVSVDVEGVGSLSFCSVTEPGVTNMISFGTTVDQATLLAAINASLVEANDETIPLIQGTYTVASSALWSQTDQCANNALIMTLEFDEPLYNPRLVRVAFDPINGGTFVDDITIEVQPLSSSPTLTGFARGISGDLSGGFGGTVVLISEVPPERIPSSSFWGLMILMVMMWCFGFWQRRPALV